MEEDNKKRRKAARREFQDNVRSLVAFVRKRDRRVAAWQQEQEKLQQQSRAKEERRCALRGYRPSLQNFQIDGLILVCLSSAGKRRRGCSACRGLGSMRRRNGCGRSSMKRALVLMMTKQLS
jgi:hypothetical protein